MLTEFAPEAKRGSERCCGARDARRVRTVEVRPARRIQHPYLRRRCGAESGAPLRWYLAWLRTRLLGAPLRSRHCFAGIVRAPGARPGPPWPVIAGCQHGLAAAVFDGSAGFGGDLAGVFRIKRELFETEGVPRAVEIDRDGLCEGRQREFEVGHVVAEILGRARQGFMAAQGFDVHAEGGLHHFVRERAVLLALARAALEPFAG